MTIFSDDEWEGGPATEDLDAVAAAEASLLDFAASRLPISDDSLVRSLFFLYEFENRTGFRFLGTNSFLNVDFFSSVV